MQTVFACFSTIFKQFDLIPYMRFPNVEHNFIILYLASTLFAHLGQTQIRKLLNFGKETVQDVNVTSKILLLNVVTITGWLFAPFLITQGR